MPAGLAITTLGGLSISLDGAPLGALASRKAEALLVYLACAGRPQARDVLAELLWDDLPAERARGNLSVLLTSLRQRLPGYLEIGRHSVALRPSGPFRLDVADLTALAEPALAQAEPGGALPPSAVRQLEQALALYGGEFLHGFSLRDGRGFEEWVRAEQERLRSLVVRVLLALAQAALVAADYPSGIARARRLLQLEPFHEEGHHLLLLLLAHSGQRGPALVHYEELCRTLDQELGVAPAPRTTELYRQIWQGELSPLSPLAPLARPAPTARPGELRGAPFTATSFVGREAELAAVAERLADPACRLLTLVGPGGVGKSRLALRAAADRAALLADGGVFVPLAPLSAAAQVAPAIAAALRFSFRGQAPPLEQLCGLLREREILLLLDNAEHLPELADIVAELLAATPRVQILVTSRERLHLQAEWLIPLDGLALPPADASPAELEQASAARLFVQRARAARPDFSLEQAPPEAVARICRLVEGLPLAIELAAAVAQSRPCAQIADELTRSLDVLRVELRDLPDRHRSMRAVFEQSWALLSPAEGALLSQVSVFRGGFSPAAAAAVCGDGEPVEATLAALAARSLLRASDDGRYATHELLRQLAAERLEPAAAAELAKRHARYYLALAGHHEPGLLGADPRPAAAALRVERDNLRLAWAWAVEHGDTAALAAGMGGLAQLYDLDGLFAEGAALFAAAASALGPDQPLHIRLTLAWAGFLLRLGRPDEALPHLEAALALAEDRGDRAGAAEAHGLLAQAHWRLGDLGVARATGRRAVKLAAELGLLRIEASAERTLSNVTRQQGDAAAAEIHAGRAQTLANKAGDPRDECRALNVLGGLLEERGAYAEAQARFGEALALARGLGDRWMEGVVLGNLGNVARDRGEHAAADAAYHESIAIYRELGDRYGEGILRFSLGNSAADWGDYAAAEAAYSDSLRLAGELGDRLGEGLALMGLGNVARHRGDAAAAADLCRRALSVVVELDARPFEAVIAVCLGHALLDLGRHTEGAACFERARELRAAIGESHREIEALAGLARAALLAGDSAAAVARIEPLLPGLLARPLEGVSEPGLIYLICAQALAAHADERAPAVRAAGAAMLRQRAARIPDPARRAAYLDAVPAHRQLLALD